MVGKTDKLRNVRGKQKYTEPQECAAGSDDEEEEEQEESAESDQSQDEIDDSHHMMWIANNPGRCTRATRPTAVQLYVTWQAQTALRRSLSRRHLFHSPSVVYRFPQSFWAYYLNSCFMDSFLIGELAGMKFALHLIPAMEFLPRWSVFLIGVLRLMMTTERNRIRARDVFRQKFCTTEMFGDGADGSRGDPVLLSIAIWGQFAKPGRRGTSGQAIYTTQEYRRYRVVVFTFTQRCNQNLCGVERTTTSIHCMVYLPDWYTLVGCETKQKHISVETAFQHYLTSGHTSANSCGTCGSSVTRYYDWHNVQWPSVLSIRINRRTQATTHLEIGEMLNVGTRMYALTSVTYYTMRRVHFEVQFRWNGRWGKYDDLSNHVVYCDNFDADWHSGLAHLLTYSLTDETPTAPMNVSKAFVVAPGFNLGHLQILSGGESE
jgi:hypothetical protein